jgi:hypothetical protein
MTEASRLLARLDEPMHLYILIQAMKRVPKFQIPMYD